MDTDLLRKWLGLPPGDWPPDPVTLLGDTSAGLHERALELMERLRPHQLRNPELVTEGMNRLAQAILALETPVQPEPITNPVWDDLLLIPEDSPQPAPSWDEFRFAPDDRPTPPAMPSAPTILDAEVVEQKPPTASPTPPVIPKPKRRKRKRTNEQPVEIPPAVPLGVSVIPDRRAGYRRLVQLRSLGRSWEKLAPFHGVPSRELSASFEIMRYLEATIECRKSLRRMKKWPHGRISGAVIAHPATLAVFRSLDPVQRKKLAGDWALTLSYLHSEEASLRESLRRNRPKPTWKRRYAWLKNRPEWMLGAVLLLATLVALIRTLNS